MIFLAILFYMDSVDFFWKQVSKALDKQNTNYEWLYNAAKISKGTFSSWKTNNRLPRIDKAYSIAKCLGVSTDWLISGKDFESSLSLDSSPEAPRPTDAVRFGGAKTENGEDYIKRMEKIVDDRSFYTPIAKLEIIKKIAELDEKTFMNVAVRVRTLIDPAFQEKN